MEIKHTPGPWSAVCNQFQRWEIHYTSGQLANVSKPDDPASPPKSWAVSEANARLIAESPMLLFALTECLEHMEHSTPQGKAAYEFARAIILRATGCA